MEVEEEPIRNTGGGNGGYRNSFGSETSGRNSSTETPLTLDKSTNYTVTIGGGGSEKSSPNDNAYSRYSSSVFITVTSIGGGKGTNLYNVGGNGGLWWW